MTEAESKDAASALWLATLQRAIGRAAHDVKDALNGVSVNLEVVRSRAGRPDAPASAVAPFAEAASQQLERLNGLLDAVLALGRAEREPADVAVALRKVASICGASASAQDAAVTVEERIGPSGHAGTRTSVRGDVVRLALAEPLLALVASGGGTERASPVLCVLEPDEDAIVVTMQADGRRAQLSDAVGEVSREAGIRVRGNSQGLSLAFPRA